MGLNARFIRSDVYDLPQVLEQRFDVVTTSLGVLVWLPDLVPWAGVVANFVKPGGTFYLLDQHPLSHVFDTQGDGDAHEFVSAIPTFGIRPGSCSPAAAGLRLQFFHEFPFSFFQQYPGMVRDADGWWRLPQHEDSIPLIFSLRAYQA